MTPQTLDLIALLCACAGGLVGFVAWRRAARTPEGVDDPFAEEGTTFLRKLLSPLARALAPSKPADVEEVSVLLLRAGRRSRDSGQRYAEERALCVLLGFGLGAYLVSAGGTGALLLGLSAMTIGLYGPRQLLLSKAKERQVEITKALPTAIDLLATCIDAGLSLEKALARVAGALQATSPILAAELQVTTQELAVGVSMRDSLHRLSRRVGLDGVSALCSVLTQAHALGAPIGGPLVEYAETSRREQMAQLEEKAGKVTAKMTIPLTLFFLPVAMVIVLAPAALKLMSFLP